MTPPTAIPLPRRLPFVILIGAILALFHRLLLGDVLFWGLPALQFYPWRDFTLTELAAGRLPLWNPYNGAGAPLLANYQSAIFYPSNLIGLLVSGPHMMGWLGMLHLLWAGLGMWLFLGALRIGGLPRAVGTLSFALNTAVVARFGTFPMLDAAVWLPWLLYAAETLLRKLDALRFILMAVVCTLLLLAGHAQWAFYSFLLCGLYVLYRLWRGRLPLRRLIWLGTAVGFGVALAAIQLVPTAELQRQSQRSGGAEESFALNYSYEAALLPTLLYPDFFGNPGRGDYIISGAYFETAAYIGLLPTIIALATVIGAVRRAFRRRTFTLDESAETKRARGLIAFFGIFALVALLFAFGKNSPLYIFLFRYVPTFSLFQAPARWLLLYVFSLSVLAAVGLSLWRPDRFLLVRSRLLLAGGVGITVIALIGRVLVDQVLLNGLLAFGVLLTVSAGLLVAWFNAARSAHRYRCWSVLVLLFVAADLTFANWYSNPTTGNHFYEIVYESGLGKPNQQPERTYRPEAEIERLQFDTFLLFDDYRVAAQRASEFRSSGLPNLNMLDRAYTFNTFEPLRPARIEAYTKLLNDHPAPNLFRAAAISIVEINPEPAWLVWTAIGSTDPLRSMAEPAWNPDQSVFLEGDAPTFRGDGTGTAYMTRPDAQTVVIQAETTTQAALVLADTWYPGWKATIDGIETPIYRANGAFRAVILPPGKVQIRFYYDPVSLKVGAVVSGVAGVILLGLLLWLRVGPIIYGLGARTSRR